MITATAPGKVVLSGEYVVIEGAPAIAAAINRRVRVTVAQNPGDHHSITTPGYLDGTWHFRLNKSGGFAWREQPPEPATFSLVEEIWKCFDTAHWPSLSVSIDTQEFYDKVSGLKLGLGSSAAVSVALTAALQRFSAAGNDPARLAMDAHGRFQGGHGSGVDVAASLQGGVIEYRRAGAESRQVGWPGNLDYRFLWSGQSAATTEKLARFRGHRGQDAIHDSMKLLSDSAEDVASAWSCEDRRKIMDSLRAYIDALRHFSVDLDLGIFDAGHERLVGLAADSGMIYKPCGAGGGDVGVAIAASEKAVDDFCDRASQQGFKSLDIAADEQGVLIAERRY